MISKHYPVFKENLIKSLTFVLFVSIKARHKQWYLFIHVCHRPIFTFEIYLPSERAFLFGAETSQAQRKWTEAIAKVFKNCIFTLNQRIFLTWGLCLSFRELELWMRAPGKNILPPIKILYKILGKCPYFIKCSKVIVKRD